MHIKPQEMKHDQKRVNALMHLDALTYSSEASFDLITRLLQMTLEMEMVTISFITADMQILKARQGLDLKESVREDAFCDIAIRQDEPLVIEDTLLDARLRDNPFVTGPPFLRCYIGAPLTTSDGYNLGTICAFGTQPRQFTQREIQLMPKFAGLVMNQLELRVQASRDFLTDVYNRRSFATGLEQELARLRRRPGTAVVAFLDLDHFKQVNDAHGHPVGDIVLREFASVVAEQCRQNDLFARLGGEEFAVLLPETDLQAAHVWAERTRRKVAETRFVKGHALRVTVSVGLVELDETHTSSDAITDLADRALYEAKRKGRDCVVS